MRRLAVPLVLGLLVGCQDVSSPLSIPADDASAAVGRSGEARFLNGQILAQFTPGAAGQAIAAAHGARPVEELRIAGIWILQVPAGREIAVASALTRNPNVTFAEPDWLLSTTPCGGDNPCLTLNDPFWGRKWDLHNDGHIRDGSGNSIATTGKAGADIDWLEAYTHLGRDFNGEAVIGILDTGIRGTHEDLAGKVIANRNFYGMGNVNPNQWNDSDGHGTHVAGIAAAHANNAKGVAGVGYGPGIKLINARVCGPMGCPTSGIANAITWAADNGANILNLSLGGPSPQTAIQTALRNAAEKNVLAFCAAGNNGHEGVSWPAAFPECVAVAATSWSDSRASYSNWGEQIELAAPGGDSNPNGTAFSYIASASNSADNSYVYMAGTSMAAPQAAGLAALVYATGTTKRDEIRTRLRETADPLGTGVPNPQFGFGRINAFRAVGGSSGGGGGGGGGDNGDPVPPTDPLVASFTYQCNNSPSCNFRDTSTGTPTSWTWTANGVEFSTNSTVTQPFESGNHTIVLTVSRGGESSSAQATISCSSHPRHGVRCR